MKHVYIIRAGKGRYKVGITSNVTKRMSALQTSNADKLELVTSRLVRDAERVERSIHAALRNMKAGGGSEWFLLTGDQAIELVVLLTKHPEIAIADHVIESIGSQVRKIIANYEAKLQDEVIRSLPEPPPIKFRPVGNVKDFEGDCKRALAVFGEEGRASTSLLQRRLSIGYGRASRIMDELERTGYISAGEGARPRNLLFATPPTV